MSQIIEEGLYEFSTGVDDLACGYWLLSQEIFGPDYSNPFEVPAYSKLSEEEKLFWRSLAGAGIMYSARNKTKGGIDGNRHK